MSQCNKLINKVPCLNPAEWQIGFTFKPLDGRPPLSAISGLYVCTQCKEELVIEDFLFDEMRKSCETIMNGLGGIVDPSSYQLRFTPIQ